ncbi:uncharacterized protein LOC142973472 isoform X2 [Anticarsia gemmatalis]|uniref:uncharacterized protein LOC142972741 isoform X3 n=1 Tax=Anticarsia gemmatalis TaxID=129554 RepID=UPI003F76A19E
MATTMMTRKATLKETEGKLKLALLEIKTYKNENSQLLGERADSEEEIKKVNQKVLDLKGELAELHIDNMDLLDQRNRLQEEVNSFSSCLGVRLYNKLPSSVMDLPQQKFKLVVKDHLIKRGYYKIDDYIMDKKSWD